MKPAKTNPENADSVNGNKSYLWNISTGLLLDIFLSVSAGCTSDKPLMFKEEVVGEETWCCPSDVDEDLFAMGDDIGHDNIGCIINDIESSKYNQQGLSIIQLSKVLLSKNAYIDLNNEVLVRFLNRNFLI